RGRRASARTTAADDHNRVVLVNWRGDLGRGVRAVEGRGRRGPRSRRWRGRGGGGRERAGRPRRGGMAAAGWGGRGGPTEGGRTAATTGALWGTTRTSAPRMSGESSARRWTSAPWTRYSTDAQPFAATAARARPARSARRR